MTPDQVLDFGKPCKEFLEAGILARAFHRHMLTVCQTPSNRGLLDFDWDDQTTALDTLRKFIKLQERNDQPDPDAEEETVYATARDGHELLLKVFRPASTIADPDTTASPLMVLYYGGGFIVGSPTILASLARKFVKRFNAVVVAPTYRLAPEHPFPTGVNDGWDTFEWIANNATTKLRTDPSKGFIVGGVSAGGGITNLIAHMARDRGTQPPITGICLSAPNVRLKDGDYDKLPEKYRERLLSPSQEECLNSATLPPSFRELINSSLKPDTTSELYGPLLWSRGHGRLPRTYSQACGMDTGRDNLLIFDDMLKNEGVETRLDLYPGLPHVFWGSYRQLPQAKKWEEDTMNGFAWLLREGE